ncbi:MAG: hypothetical protein ACRDJN_12475, partial [Chloroflexota bacterium]
MCREGPCADGAHHDPLALDGPVGPPGADPVARPAPLPLRAAPDAGPRRPNHRARRPRRRTVLG